MTFALQLAPAHGYVLAAVGVTYIVHVSDTSIHANYQPRHATRKP